MKFFLIRRDVRGPAAIAAVEVRDGIVRHDDGRTELVRDLVPEGDVSDEVTKALDAIAVLHKPKIGGA